MNTRLFTQNARRLQYSIHTRRRHLSILAAVIMGGRLLSACGGNSGPSNAPSTPTEAALAAATSTQASAAAAPVTVKAEDIQAILNIQPADFSALIKSDVSSGKWIVYKPFTGSLDKMFDAALLKSVTDAGASGGAAIVFEDQNASDPLELVNFFATVYNTAAAAKHGSTLWTQHNDANVTGAYAYVGSLSINGEQVASYIFNGLKQGNAWSESFVFYNNLNLLASLGGTDVTAAGRKKLDQIGLDLNTAIISKLIAKESGY